MDVILPYHLEEFGEDDNLTAHAAVHGVVENQIAMGEEFPTRQTVERLMKEGIDWHEAIDAVGAVVMAQRWDARKDGRIFDEARYCEEFRDFTVAKWRAAYED